MKKHFLLFAALCLILSAVIGICFFIQHAKLYNIANSSSSLAQRSPAELQNIMTALSKIDGCAVAPGEVFSFNITVGERNISSGFQKARSIVMDKISDDFGGGICQLSSILYHAVLLADLPVMERHPHPGIPKSVSAGLDATVSFGSRDLKFKNNLKYPVKLEVKVKGERLVVNIFSRLKTNKQVYLFTKENSLGSFLEVKTYRVRKLSALEQYCQLISCDKYQKGGI